ncbi:MAG: hypothetical protein HUK17_03555 [Bacteroidales bacterium]|nr:hypothetical protein [Bacteroidales bacterium]
MKKHNTIKPLILTLLMLVGGVGAQAQFEQSVFLNANLPLGDMSQKTNPNPATQLLGKEAIGSNAIVGFGMGYRAAYHFDIGFGEVAPFVSADFLWNRINGDMREANTLANRKSPNYFNVPAFLGIAYYYELNEIFTPFAEFALGYDFLFITPEGNKDDVYYRYRLQNSLAWQVGLGCYFGTHVSVGVHYYGLGKHYVTYNTDKSNFAPTDLIASSDFNQAQPLSAGSLLLRIGFHF